MTRILADLPDEDIKWLDQLAAEQGKSRAQLLREAVAAYRPQGANGWIDAGFGLWTDRFDLDVADDWQDQERAGWTRPWDEDFDANRQDFPDQFDGFDDQEREHYRTLNRAKDGRGRDDA
ncbi:MAG: ribbon-helix-helix domain-containing protein [Blastomonas sp.]